MKDYPRLDESISFLSNLLIQMFFIISKAIYFAHRLAIFDWITLKRTTSPPRKKRCLLNCIENTANILDARFLETRAYLIKNICATQNLNSVRNLMIQQMFLRHSRLSIILKYVLQSRLIFFLSKVSGEVSAF